MRIILFLFMTITSILHANIPTDLCINGKPLHNEHIITFFSQAILGYWEPYYEFDLTDPLEEPVKHPKIDFTWDYIGTVHNKYHVVKVYYWEDGCMGKYTGLLLLKREDNLLKITDIVLGGDRHSSCIRNGKVENSTLHYSQGITTGGIVDTALEMHPELQPLYEKSSKKATGYGEACAYGICKYMAAVSTEGKIIDRQLVTFHACEGEIETDELYQKGGIKAVAIDLLERD